MRRIVLLVCLVAWAGCGGGNTSSDVRVSAASSLKPPFNEIGGARFSFAGSDQLAAQIRSGVKPDVFASANTKLPDELYADGLVEKPVTFAGNRLVLAVPAAEAKVASLQDVETPGVKLAIGSESVPIGAYTRTVLGKLPESEAS